MLNAFRRQRVRSPRRERYLDDEVTENGERKGDEGQEGRRTMVVVDDG